MWSCAGKAVQDLVPDVVRATIHVVEGLPTEVLLQRSKQLDLLFVGSRGYGPLGRVLMGSVSTTLVRECTCPGDRRPRGRRTRGARPRPAKRGTWCRPDVAGVLIAGGGIAGLEAALALADLAGDQADLTLLAPESDFVYKPLMVEEPFTHEPTERHELAPALAEIGVELVRGTLASVSPDEYAVTTKAKTTLVRPTRCLRRRSPQPGYDNVETFWKLSNGSSRRRADPPGQLLAQAARWSRGSAGHELVAPAL